MRALIRVLCGVLAAALCAGGAHAQEPAKVALVIGNGGYESPPPFLVNPPEDARIIAAALEQVGFDVELATDVDQEGMLDALARLTARLADAGPDPVALVYFAGHGVEEGGYNYLIPLNARIELARYYRTRAVSADEVLDAMQGGGARLSFLILDACRNNPLPRSLRTQGAAGLAAMTPASGTVIAYATAPGNVAADGYGANSPYAAALAQAIVQPGLDYDDMFSLTTSLVRADPAAGRYNQIPAYYASREGEDFCFAGCGPGGAPIVAAPATDPDRDRMALELAALRAENARLAALDRGTSGVTPTTPAVVDRPAAGSSDAERARAAAGAGRPVAERAFRDCDVCPEMVVIPAGSFAMGSPAGEVGREEDEDDRAGAGGAARRVTIPTAFAVGKLEVTWEQWEACVRGGGCEASGPEGAGGDEGWGRGSRPVINVDWNDAQAYVRWLSRETGESYRLLTEAEWEYAARADSTTPYHFGSNSSGLCQYGNVADQTAKRSNPGWTIAECDDGYLNTAPVGSFDPNAFGLHDMHGNVWEWVKDCYVDSYSGALTDGAAVGTGNCSYRALRGGSWNYVPRNVRSANRRRLVPASSYNDVGFRVARTL